MAQPRARLHRLLAATATVALLTGCETMIGMKDVDPAPTGSVTEARPTPKLQPGDKIRLSVYGEDKLAGDYELDAGGSVAVPLAGAVKVEGLSLKDAEQAIAKRLKEKNILRHPVVTANMAAFRPFYVLGEVDKPGGYAFQNGINVMSAIALAGGHTYRASKSRILVQRAGEKTFTEYPMSPEVLIHPGDLISVPERFF